MFLIDESAVFRVAFCWLDSFQLYSNHMDGIFDDLFVYSPSIVEFCYNQNQKELVHCAIKTIFSLDHRVFSGGIYLYYETEKNSFGDFDQKEILYVGESDQYSRRFRNHNLEKSADGNKRKFVDQYFETHTYLGFYLFAFKRLTSNVILEDTNDDVIDHEHDSILLDQKFIEHRHLFERILVREFKNYREINPLWFNDRERKTFLGDEAMLQATNFIRWFYGDDNYALDYHIDNGFDLARKMQETAFQNHPLARNPTR